MQAQMLIRKTVLGDIYWNILAVRLKCFQTELREKGEYAEETKVEGVCLLQSFVMWFFSMIT